MLTLWQRWVWSRNLPLEIEMFGVMFAAKPFCCGAQRTILKAAFGRTCGVIMSPVTIYTTSLCPYCHMAKELLSDKRVAFTEINAEPRDVRAALQVKAGGLTSVPQIWIGDTHVGGCDDLYALEARGALDALLRG
jgi:glutaredoxin 3